MSPPLPLIQRTFRLAPSSGSAPRIFELVFPPPKFVMRKSDPRRLDRYRSNSGASKLRATFSSHRSSKCRNFSEVFISFVEEMLALFLAALSCGDLRFQGFRPY